MLAFLGWLAVSAGFAWMLHARHLAHYLLDAAICIGAVVWFVLGVGLVARGAQRLSTQKSKGAFTPAEVDRMIAEQRKREAQTAVPR
jgi:hypothetical protein